MVQIVGFKCFTVFVTVIGETTGVACTKLEELLETGCKAACPISALLATGGETVCAFVAADVLATVGTVLVELLVPNCVVV